MRALSPVLAVLVALVLAACGGGGGGGAGGNAGAGAGDPSPSAGEGEQLFAANCAVCHGPGATGTDQGPPLVHEIYEPSHHPDDSFRSAVANGVQPHHWEFGPMPRLPNLEADKVDAIIAYVRGLQRDAGIE